MSKQNLLSPKETAAYLGVKEETLNVWRCTRKVNIPYTYTGSSVKYPKEYLTKFIEENKVQIKK